MITLQSYFQKMFVINLARRPDRLENFQREMKLNGIPLDKIERFEAYDFPQSGITGATKSHRAVIRQIAQGPWERALIFEDDAEAITLEKLKAGGFVAQQQVWKTHASVLDGYGTLRDRFAYLARFIPAQWDMLWLGGGYGDKPISRVNRHIIRFGYMKNCAAYGISRNFAREWTKITDSTTPPETHAAVDDMFREFANDHHFYIFQPRLIFTGKVKSDVNGLEASYLFSMTDPVHESMV